MDNTDSAISFHRLSMSVQQHITGNTVLYREVSLFQGPFTTAAMRLVLYREVSLFHAEILCTSMHYGKADIN